MDVAIQAWLDQEDAHIGGTVRRDGWFIQSVGGSEMCTLPGCHCGDDQDTVPFAYTVSLGAGLRRTENAAKTRHLPSLTRHQVGILNLRRRLSGEGS
jgi:hypothetical protein